MASHSEDGEDRDLSSHDESSDHSSGSDSDDSVADNAVNPFEDVERASSLVDPSESLDLGYLLRPIPRPLLELILVRVLERHPSEIDNILHDAQDDIDVTDVLHTLQSAIEEGQSDDSNVFTLFKCINEMNALTQRAVDYVCANHIRNAFLILSSCTHGIVRFAKETIEGKCLSEGEAEYTQMDELMKAVEIAWQKVIQHQRRAVDASTSNSSSALVDPHEVPLVPPPRSGSLLSIGEFDAIESILSEMKKTLTNVMGPFGSDALRELKAVQKKRKEVESTHFNGKMKRKEGSDDEEGKKIAETNESAGDEGSKLHKKSKVEIH